MGQFLLSTAQAAGSALAQAAPAIGQAAGQAAAAYAAGLVTAALAGPDRRRLEGPRTERVRLQSAAEGVGVPRVFGRARVAGQIIWATNIKEMRTDERTEVGGKLGPSQVIETTEFSYSVSLAVGLCEGEIDRVARVWADGNPAPLGAAAVRVHRGSETQAPDPLIEALEGAGNAPAFRGLAYVVIEDLPLAPYGNRIPQLTFEVVRSLRRDDPQALENALQAICLIPGSGEAALSPTPIRREIAEGETTPENVHNAFGETDLKVALDALEAAAPNVKSVSLFVTWFGTDLRAGECRIEPRVEIKDKATTPSSWSVSGLSRATANAVSTKDDRPAFGGTPSDATVIAAIQELKARGFHVLLHPFLIMDVPPGNGLPDPYGGAEQATYPWRGRITGSDKQAAAAAEVAAFFGTAAPADFSPSQTGVGYSGPAEFSWRRFALHHAHLAAEAGADAVLLGSELRGLTTLRDDAGAFPAVAALKALAAEVRSVVGPDIEIAYAADWSEYFGHQPSDGTGDVYFHLDPLWADENIDAVAIDWYAPLADWRDETGHADEAAGSIYSLDYLKGNLRGGDGFDWYYASAADRDAQVRTPITDGAYGEPWVFRYKDLATWWGRAHHDRPGGVRAASPTAWTPGMKPVWLAEAGCPAVDKGANQPNVFVDPKSSESALPYYSNGARDDLMQRRYLEALHAALEDPAANPASSAYGGPMIPADRIYAYTWDTRPYPDFPGRVEVWSDGPNWATGHWISGRIERAPLAALVEALGAPWTDGAALDDLVTGFVLLDPTSGRAAIEPLAAIYRFDLVQRGPGIVARPRRAVADIEIDPDDLAIMGAIGLERTREDERARAGSLRLSFIDEGADFRPGLAEAFRAGGDAGAVEVIDAPVAMEPAEAAARAASLLPEADAARESVRFALPPTRLDIEAGDVVSIETEEGARRVRIVAIDRAESVVCEAVAVSGEADQLRVGPPRFSLAPAAASFGPPLVAILDLPLLSDDGDESAVWGAAFAAPWPGAVAIRRKQVLERVGAATTPATMGRLVDPMSEGPAGRRIATSILIDAAQADFRSRTPEEVLAGANMLAIRSTGGDWEIVQYETAVLVGPSRWRLSGLLRGQRGSAPAAADAGARVVSLGAGLAPLAVRPEAFGFPVEWSAVAVGEALGGPQTVFLTETLTGVPRRPYAPAHLRVAEEAGGRAISWIRRARIGGDPWGEFEPPLAEEAERYEAAILSGETVVRVFETAAPAAAYSAADILADFGVGGPAPGARVRVRQISARYGYGLAATAPLVPPT